MSLLADLFSTLDTRGVGDIAGALGEPEQSVSRGLQSSIATVLGGMATKSNNPATLQKVLDLTPTGIGDTSWSNLARGIADPNSPMMSVGQRMISTLFGGSEGSLARALGSGTGLQPGITSSLLTMVAPMVMGFLGRRVRDERMSMAGLGSLLQREVPAVRAALPAGVTDLLWPREREAAVGASPVVAQAVTPERSSRGWVLPLVLVCLIPLLAWLFSHGRRPVVIQAPPQVGTANRMAPTIPAPAQAPAQPANINLFFDTASNRLQPDSAARLRKFVAVLTPNKDAHLTVSGYTDNVGSADSNMKLSKERADAVEGDLEHLGIAPDRITAQGFGEENPIADNSTAEGRQTNRRVSVGIEGR